jgi:hypothetical protein
MIRRCHEADELSYDLTLLSGVAEAVRWRHFRDRTARGRLDPRVAVYFTCLEEFTLSLRNLNMRILNFEMAFHPWDDSSVRV